MKSILFAAIFTALVLVAGTAEADRIQLPHDPDVSLSIGSGGFFGTSKKANFQRIQPTFLRLELTAFKSPERRWFNRMNLYCSASPEFAELTYKGQLEDVTIEDDQGNEYTIQEDGLERADLKADTNFSGGCGLRLSVYDRPRFHLDWFGEFATAFRPVPTTPETVIVSWSGLSLDVARVAAETADMSFDWHMVHTGLTMGFPLSKWRGHKNVRMTPFVTLGLIHFKAGIEIELHEEFLSQLESFGVDEDIIPKKEGVEVNNLTASVGARLDIGSNHAFETAGAFFFTRAGTRVYWATLSYSIRFDYPW